MRVGLLDGSKMEESAVRTYEAQILGAGSDDFRASCHAEISGMDLLCCKRPTLTDDREWSVYINSATDAHEPNYR